MPELDANGVVDDFAREFEAVLAEHGATLIRLQEGHSDRGFAILRPPALLRFVAKLSQSKTGFWGLGVTKAETMVQSPGEFLLLLGSSDTGYIISPTRLRTILPKLGTDQDRRDYKIQEAKVRRELRFRSLEELAEQLLPRLVESAATSI